MRTNWKKVGLELELWKVADATVDAFREGNIDAATFRNACRNAGVNEDAIDFHINEIEA